MTSDTGRAMRELIAAILAALLGRGHSGAPATRPAGNPLEGKPLRYLIGADAPGPGRDGEVIECGYNVVRPAANGIAVKYCNLFDEENTGRFGPYLQTSETAAQYHEGQIDPRGPVVELDNPDAYDVNDVLGAVDLAASYGLTVVAKNPLLIEDDPTPYVVHRSVAGVIVERGAGNPPDMDALRKRAGKPALPVWFVAFGGGKRWATDTAKAAARFRNMGVTWSAAGEYGDAIDIHLPAQAG
jgi:hypothetical protein